ncbi:hypothetical protein [Amycolatopsis tucumanensis]|uniref:Uncharacterized protein n=1 Tax=Amycolatopsis tucumanensis TaxID=401106 RepID=A0ABP7I7V0_9PSEU|nr:hypothetical protein [Amycolatopsis tucumanensis]MCF6425939.1 hypothetical protein [Amycolatopsis tucumanensis]
MTDNRQRRDHTTAIEGERAGHQPDRHLASEEVFAVNSESLFAVIFLVALGVTIIGWRTVIVMTLTAGFVLAVLGFAQLVSFLGTGA